MIEHKEFTDVPTCWNSSKVRYIYSITKAKKPTELLDNPEDGTEIYLSMDVIRKRNENLQYSHTGDLATEDDMLLLWDGSNAGEIIDKHPRGFAPSTTAILKNISSNNQCYCFYAMKYLERFIRSNTVGMGVPHVDGDYLKSLRFITPSNADQERIANHLDHKISVIDSILDSKDELINLLYEQRVGIISQAVTKGLYPDSVMKDCGVKWLGQIPAHWRVVPAKALFAQSKETRHETDIQLTASQKYGIISQEDYMERQSYKIVLADKGLENWKHVEPNDFIISLRSFQGGLEISYIPGCITWHYIVLKPKAGVDPEYFKWLFKSPRYIQALQRTANFIRDGQDLRFSNFVQVPLPLIPMDEQKEIAEYLNKETARIDSIIADITEQIEKLKEYRQSVISEVVTGKVAVE